MPAHPDQKHPLSDKANIRPVELAVELAKAEVREREKNNFEDILLKKLSAALLKTSEENRRIMEAGIKQHK